MSTLPYCMEGLIAAAGCLNYWSSRTQFTNIYDEQGVFWLGENFYTSIYIILLSLYIIELHAEFFPYNKKRNSELLYESFTDIKTKQDNLLHN